MPVPSRNRWSPIRGDIEGEIDTELSEDNWFEENELRGTGINFNYTVWHMQKLQRSTVALA